MKRILLTALLGLMLVIGPNLSPSLVGQVTSTGGQVIPGGSSGAGGTSSGLTYHSQLFSKWFGSMTGTEGQTDAVAYAICVGMIQKDATSFIVRLTTTTAAAGTGAAELAIATGVPVVANGNPTLTVKGYVDFSTQIKASAGAQTGTVTATVAAGSYVWVVLYQNLNSTASAVRSGATADPLTTGWYANVAATQPSTIVSTPTVFTGGSTDIPVVWVLPS